MTIQSADSIDTRSPSYVLPSPRRATGEVIVVTPGGEGAEDGPRVARLLGERFLALAECQQQFLAELRTRLAALDGGIAEDSRAQLKGALREAVSVLDWCDSVQSDLQHDCRRAAQGSEPIDLLAACRDVVAGVADTGPIQVTGRATDPWWGDSAALRDAVRHGLALVAERTGSLGGRHVEVGVSTGAPWLRIRSHGEPGDSLEVQSVRRFRQAVDRLGARVLPDELGPGGAGLVIHLPTAAAD